MALRTPPRAAPLRGFFIFLLFFLIKAHTRRYRSLIKNISLVLWVNFVQADGELSKT